MTKHLILIISAFFASPVFAQNIVEPGYDIIILAGQSNAAGVGLGPFTDPFSLPDINNRIFQIGRFGDHNVKIIPADDILESWDKKLPTVTFATSFARRYAATSLAPQRKVLIVPVAKGGSVSYQWDDKVDSSLRVPGMPGFDDSTVLLEDLLQRTQIAMQAPGTNRVVALLWHQGESDVACLAKNAWCNSATPNAEAYKTRMQYVFTKIRKQFPASKIPVLVGGLVPSWKGFVTEKSSWLEKWKANNQKAQIEDALKSVSSWLGTSAFVSSDKLLSNDDVLKNQDTIHFCAQSSIELGARYFEAYRKLSSTLAQ